MNMQHDRARAWPVVVLIPAQNEERFIGSVVLQARRHADTVIVVDDGSTDGTAEIAETAGAMVPRHARNRGNGTALNTGFRVARELCPQVVVLLDGDGQHPPDEIPQMIAPVLAGEADIVRGGFQARSAAAAAVLTAGLDHDARPRGLLEYAWRNWDSDGGRCVFGQTGPCWSFCAGTFGDTVERG